jgi:hypothetical protein
MTREALGMMREGTISNKIGDCIKEQALFYIQHEEHRTSSSDQKHWDICYRQRQYNLNVSQNPLLPPLSRFSSLEKWLYLVVSQEVCEEANRFGLSKLLA